MAAKRMFSIDVVDTDKFLDMPVSTQEQELFNLVNKRMEHGKITIYTSNMDANALNVDARTRDRIIKTSIVCHVAAH